MGMGTGMGMNFMGDRVVMGLQPMVMGLKLMEMGWDGEGFVGWGGDGSDVHYCVTLYCPPQR